MWQMAAVLEFLNAFSLHLQLRGSFTPEELEVAIVSEAAQTGLLANLHQVIYHLCLGTLFIAAAMTNGKHQAVACLFCLQQMAHRVFIRWLINHRATELLVWGKGGMKS